jgi:heterodisulfide reductase subunit A-like polyferredoxin
LLRSRALHQEGRQMVRLGEHAIVIGGSIAGLMAARVLSDYFSHATVLERDLVEDRAVIHKSAPQGNHLHALSVLQEEPLRRSVLARMRT